MTIRFNTGIMAMRFLKAYNRLPLNFDQWDLQCFGKPIAFKMVELGFTLNGFKRWHMTHETINIAMYAGAYGMLPDDFDQWDIATKDGVTVAMICIVKDNLPITFDNFDKALLEFKNNYDVYKGY